MSRTPRPRLLAALTLAGALALTGCGDDGDDKDASTPTEADAPATDGATGDDAPAGDDAGSGDPDDVDLEGALDAMGLENKGDALVSATDAERYEIEGDVIHLYLGDSAGVPEGTECMILNAVLSAGESAVVHREDGTEVPCEAS